MVVFYDHLYTWLLKEDGIKDIAEDVVEVEGAVMLEDGDNANRREGILLAQNVLLVMAIVRFPSFNIC